MKSYTFCVNVLGPIDSMWMVNGAPFVEEEEDEEGGADDKENGCHSAGETSGKFTQQNCPG